MAPIPRPVPPTLRAIQAALEDKDDWESVGISAGDIGVECDRTIWLAFRRCSVPEKPDWKARRIFERGNIEEERLLDLLRLVGIEVWGEQDKVRACGGHLRGKIDGRALGLLEAPQTEHLVECKSSNDKGYKPVEKDGVKIGKPLHYATFQFYMHGLGLSRVLYLMSNKDNELIHYERVEYDAEFAIRLVARIERLINLPEPPARLCNDRDDFRGRFCRQAQVCWQDVWPRSHCRTCIHATPIMAGDAGWDCARWSKPLSLAEQAAGCQAHLFIPALIAGEQIDADDELETVTYRLRSGRIWVDGGANDDQQAA